MVTSKSFRKTARLLMRSSAWAAAGAASVQSAAATRSEGVREVARPVAIGSTGHYSVELAGAVQEVPEGDHRVRVGPRPTGADATDPAAGPSGVGLARA